MRHADVHKGYYRPRFVVPKELIDHLPGEYPAGKPLKGRRYIVGPSTGIPKIGGDHELAQARINAFGDTVVKPAIEAARAAIDPARRLITVFDMRHLEYHSFEMPDHLVRKQRILQMPANTPGLIDVGGGYHIFNEFDDDPAPKPVAPVTTEPKLVEDIEVADSETVIGFWRSDRTTKPTPKAIKRKRAVIEQLFKFLNVDPIREFVDLDDGKTYRAYDLTKPSPDDLQRFKESIPEKQRNDVLSHVKKLYKTATQNRKFAKLPGGNPAKVLHVPVKQKPEEEWESFDEWEAKSIYEAALVCLDPCVRWTEILSCWLGTIVSEVARRKVSDFKQDPYGNWYLDIPEGKTEARPRRVPLRADKLEPLGFLDFLDERRREGGRDAPLFTVSSATVANRCRDFLREVVKIKDGNKQFNGWRKRFINQLINIAQHDRKIDCDYDRRRYLAGHVSKDPHAERYLKHPVHNTKPIIDRLVDPTDEPKKMAA